MDGIIGKKEMKKMMDERILIIEPLLEENKQIETIGIDLRLDNRFVEFIRTNEPYLTPAEEGTGLKRMEKDFFGSSYFLQPSVV